jgi:uncharacterized protein YceK
MRSTRSVLAAAALLALAGCSSTVAGTALPEGAAPADASAVAAAEDQAGGAPAAGAVDACALLSAADVTPFVGAGVAPRPSGNGDGGTCTWENQEDYHSVTVEIGRSGSAPGGKLPPWDSASFGPERTLPDGMRGIVTGQVEFVGGGRDCTLQVSTVSADDEENAVELARKVRDQL